MILTNIETVPGKTVVGHFGVVSGSTVRAKHVGRDLMASLKNIVGGELKGYTELLQDSRNQAIQRMLLQAQELGRYLGQLRRHHTRQDAAPHDAGTMEHGDANQS